ncbi:MAG: preprotein translocase subunit SecE [Candidatus Zipacnadales bacterium]
MGSRLKAPFVATAQFLNDVWFELKRVVWPSREEAQSFTAVVIIAVAIVAVWVGTLDWFCTALVALLKLYGS